MQSRVIYSTFNHKYIMATQVSVIQFKGRLSNTMGTRRQGKVEIHMHRFIEKEDIESKPAFENTRRNNSEFKGASKAVNSLMGCFGGNGKRFGGKFYRARLLRETLAMVKRGPGDDGSRSFLVVGNAFDLRNFDMNLADQFLSRFTDLPAPVVNTDRNQAVLTIPSFAADEVVVAPEGAKKFKLKLYVGVLSDLVMGTNGKYELVNPNTNRQVGIATSAALPVTGAISGIVLTATLPGSPVLPTTAGLVVSVSIEFFKETNGNLSLLAQGNALQIIDVY